MNLGLIAATVGLIAAAEGIPTDMLDPVARLGAVGVLGFLVVWNHTRTQPAKDKLFTESVDKLSTAINELRVNCAAKQKD